MEPEQLEDSVVQAGNVATLLEALELHLLQVEKGDVVVSLLTEVDEQLAAALSSVSNSDERRRQEHRAGIIATRMCTERFNQIRERRSP